jgi:acetylglutamate synthase
VWCLAGRKVSSAKTELCDCNKNSISKSSIITTKNKVMSINQLNHKVPEKYHATKELVSRSTNWNVTMWLVSQLPPFFCSHAGHCQLSHAVQFLKTS